MGTVVGAQAAFRNWGEVSPVYFVIGGAIIGMFAGCLIALLDSPPRDTPSEPNFEDDLPPHLTRKKTVPRSGLVGKVLALIGIPICLFPLVGLIFTVAALVVNRNSIGWTKTVSWIAVSISICLSVLVAIGLIIENFG